MAKFDFTTLEGYREDMTAEEKLALLENYDPEPGAPAPVPNADPEPAPKPTLKGELKGYIPKAQFDKLSSELAAAKKQIRAKMTEDEQKEADRLAEQEAMRLELEGLRKEKTLSTYKASYLAQGYDEALATETAEAMVEGDMERVFANMRKNIESQKKAWTAEVLKNTPVPPAGTNPDTDAQKQKEQAELRRSFGLPTK